MGPGEATFHRRRMVYRGEYRVASARQTPESQLLVPSANWQALAGAKLVGPHRARRKVLLNYGETRKAAARIAVGGTRCSRKRT